MRRRLAFAIAGVATVAVILFAVPLAISLRQVYRDEDLLRLERDTVAATRAIDVSRRSSDPIELPSGPDRHAVYDTGGRLRAGKSAAGDRVIARRALRTRRPAVAASGGHLFAAVPLLAGERVSGILVSQRAASGAAQDTRRAWLLIGGLALALILAALGAALLLGRGLARPLERLVRAARRLGRGDFTVRAPGSSVPEVDALASALNATAARLGDLLARERAFSADASHQLRTPLAALRIELEAAEMTGVGADPEAALRQVERLEQTIATLLAVARDSPRSRAETHLVALIDQLESEWRPRLALEGRPLRVEIERGDLRAAAHESVVREIADVLLDNALRHGAGAVTLVARSRDDWIGLEVHDEGSGFGDDRDAAFERGTSREGYGIGLALARSLAQAESGGLVISSPGPKPVVSLLLRPASASRAASPAQTGSG